MKLETRLIPGTNPQLSYFALRPPGQPVARLAILHGYGDHAGRYSHFMQWLAERSVASYAIDFRGHGRSAGKPGFIRRWDEHLTDLSAFLAIDELSNQSDTAPLFVMGHSHGGLIATVAAVRGLLDHCRGVILSAPFLDLKMPVPKIKRFLGGIMSLVHPSMAIRSGLNSSMLTRDPEMIADSKADPYCRGIATPGWFFQTQKMQARTRPLAGEFKLPLLMLVPGQDEVANSSVTIEFFRQCGAADKTLVHYPEHRHELMRELDREPIFQTVFDWMENRASLKQPATLSGGRP